MQKSIAAMCAIPEEPPDDDAPEHIILGNSSSEYWTATCNASVTTEVLQNLSFYRFLAPVCSLCRLAPTCLSKKIGSREPNFSNNVTLELFYQPCPRFAQHIAQLETRWINVGVCPLCWRMRAITDLSASSARGCTVNFVSHSQKFFPEDPGSTCSCPTVRRELHRFFHGKYGYRPQLRARSGFWRGHDCDRCHCYCMSHYDGSTGQI